MFRYLNNKENKNIEKTHIQGKNFIPSITVIEKLIDHVKGLEIVNLYDIVITYQR